MNWKLLFSNTILTRGRTYYKEHRVHDFIDKAGTCTAEVWGSRVYNVTIREPGTNGMKMSCGCPYARDGFNCKHMAAVLFKWEESDKKNAGPSMTSAEIFPKPAKGREPFFNLSEIMKGYEIKPGMLRTARELIEGGHIRLHSYSMLHDAFFIRQTSKSGIGAAVYINGIYLEPGAEPGEEKVLGIILTREQIYRIICRACNLFEEQYYYDERNLKLCPHSLALLLLFDEYARKYDPGDYTDYRGSKFLKAFSRERARAASESSGSVARETVILEPKLSRKADEKTELSFRIGNGGKMFVVKNLTELHDIVNKGGKFELGRSGEIDFTMETFDEDSKILYDLIEREVKRARAIEEKLESRRTYYYSGSVETRRAITFTGDAVDTVYDMMYGKMIDYKSDLDSAKSLLVTRAVPSVDITINNGGVRDRRGSTPQFEYLSVTGRTPEILDGVKGKYFIKDGKFSRIDDETWSRITPFTEAASPNHPGQFEIRIGRKNVADFYYNILPELRNDPVFRIQESFTEMLGIPEEAEFTFYMDAEDDQILCEAVSAYGDNEYRLRGFADDEFPLEPERDLGQELPVYELLAEMFDHFDPARKAYVLEDSDDARYDLMKSGMNRLMSFGEVNSTDAFMARRIRRTPSFQIGVSVESDLLNLEIITQDVSYEDLAALLQSYRLKKRYHRLKSGAFVDLEDNSSLDTLVSTLEAAGADTDDLASGMLKIPAYRALYLDKMLEGHEELVAGRDRHFRNLIRNFKTISDAEFEIPEGLNGTLRPYQDHGYRWLCTLETAGFGGILADDMGLGKTIQVITMLLAAKGDGDVCGLVVCPASVLYNWIDELGRFAPDLNAVAVTGTKSERRKILADYAGYDVLVTSYDLLKRDIDTYKDLEFTHQILDEAQFIKNAKAAASKSVKLVKANHRFALTGTPIENRLSELWSIFDFLMPGFLYSYDQFRKTFEVPISKNGDEGATEMLKSMISPFILRRKKKDVLKDLPDKIEEVRYAHMDDEQRKVYDGQAVRISKLIEEKGDFNTGKIEILAELTRIRQICCDPGLLLADYTGGSAKREACIDLVRSAVDGGHKMLLFSQFTSMLAVLEEDLKREEINYYKLTGETSKEERMRLVKAFNSDDTPVFLISLKAGGTGLNLTGADIVIHYDPWWNTAAQDQATDRAHRIGQTRDVTVFKLIAKDTIEEKILRLQETKKELADAVLSGETRSLGSMSKEELLELIS